MAKKVYIGVDDITRKIKKLYIGVNGIAYEIKKAYIGVDNVAKLCYENGVTWMKYTIKKTYSKGEERYYSDVRNSTISTWDWYKGWSVNAETGAISLTNFDKRSSFANLSGGTIGAVRYCEANEKFYFYQTGYLCVKRTGDYLAYGPLTAALNQEKGEYIGDVTAPDGTYPNDGIQDGFWYVKQVGSYN